MDEKKPPSKKRTLIVLIGLAAILAVWWVWFQGPTAPFLTNPEKVAPEVLSLIREHYRGARLAPWSAKRWAELGKVYEANDILNGAEVSYRGSLERDDRNAETWFRLAMTLKRMKKDDEALAALDRVIEIDATFVPAHWRRGEWLLQQRNLPEAKRSFSSATQLNPSCTPAFVGLAEVALLEKKYGKVINMLRSPMFTRGPSAAYAEHLYAKAQQGQGDLEAARRRLRRASPVRPVFDDEWTDRLSEYRRGLRSTMAAAQRLVALGRPGDAVKLLEHLRKAYPKDINVLCNLGSAYSEADRLDDAFKALEEAEAIQSDHFAVQLNLSIAHLKNNNAEKALVHVNRAVALNDAVGDAHVQKGRTHKKLGQFEEAGLAFERAIEFKGEQPFLLLGVGECCAKTGKWRESAECFERVLARVPSHESALLGLAVAEIEQGLLDRAWATLERAAIYLGENHPPVMASRQRIKQLRSQKN